MKVGMEVNMCWEKDLSYLLMDHEMSLPTNLDISQLIQNDNALGADDGYRPNQGMPPG